METGVILNSSVRFRELDGEGVVINQSSAEVLLVNGVGVDIIQRIHTEKKVVDLIDELAAEYSVDPAELKADVIQYIHDLQLAGIVSLTGSS